MFFFSLICHEVDFEVGSLKTVALFTCHLKVLLFVYQRVPVFGRPLHLLVGTNRNNSTYVPVP